MPQQIAISPKSLSLTRRDTRYVWSQMCEILIKWNTPVTALIFFKKNGMLKDNIGGVSGVLCRHWGPGCCLVCAHLWVLTSNPISMGGRWEGAETIPQHPPRQDTVSLTPPGVNGIFLGHNLVFFFKVLTQQVVNAPSPDTSPRPLPGLMALFRKRNAYSFAVLNFENFNLI